MAGGEARSSMADRGSGMQTMHTSPRRGGGNAASLCYQVASPRMFVPGRREARENACKRTFVLCMQQTLRDGDSAREVRKKPSQQKRSSNEDRRMRLRAWEASQGSGQVQPSMLDAENVLMSFCCVMPNATDHTCPLRLGNFRSCNREPVSFNSLLFELREGRYSTRTGEESNAVVSSSNGLSWSECETVEEAVGGENVSYASSGCPEMSGRERLCDCNDEDSGRGRL
eukprot:763008-Hanusia_phi.AAC.3